MTTGNFLACAALLLTIAAPASAQISGPPSDQFVEAVKQQNIATAQQLLHDHPTIVNARDGKGVTPLIIAISRGDASWTAFLINKGADLELGDRAHGDTPIIAAARVGFDQAAEWLLSQGAKVDSTNRMGETALIVAVQQRATRLVKLLLRNGADPDKTDAAAGYSARDYAKRDTRSRDILQAIMAAKP